MNRFLKWVLAIAVTVAILLLVVSIALPLLLDPNNYKDEINAAVLRETGRELTIAGDISWRVLPSIGIEVDQLSLANRPGFGTRPMLEVTQASVSAKLLPLFSRQLEISRIDLEGVTAYLRSNVDGQNNWEDLAGGGGGNTAAADTTQEIPADFEIEINDGSLGLKNTARRVEFEGFDGETPPGGFNQSFELDGNCKLELPQQDIVGTASLDGLLQAVRGRGLLGFEDAVFSFDGTKGPAENTLPLELETSTDIIVDLARDQAVLSDLTLQFFDVVASGLITVLSLSGEQEYTGHLELAEFSPKQLIKNLGMEPPSTLDPEVLRKMQAELSFTGTTAGMDITELEIVLDRSLLDGRLSIEAYDPLQLDFDLAIDTLNLDDYSLVPAAETDDNVEVGGAGLFVGSMLFFTGGGDFSIAQLVTGGLTAGDVKVTISSTTDEIRLFPMSSRFYGGQHQGDVRVNFGAERPVLTANQVVSGFETSTVLQDMAGFGRLHGTGDFYLKIRSVLGDAQQVRQSLTGDVGLSVTDGVIDDVDVSGTVDKVMTLLGQSDASVGGVGDSDRMEFAELIITGIIDRGIWRSDDLMLRSEMLNATGEGTVNLVNETINYIVFTVLDGTLAAQVPEGFRDMTVPVRISGNMYEPEVSLDIAAGLMASQNAEIVDKAGKAAKTLLDGLLGKQKDKKK